MPIETDDAYTPGWWLKVLSQRLQDRRTGRLSGKAWARNQVASSKSRPPLDLLDDYWRGDPPLRRDIHSGWADQFRQYARMGRINVADLLVSSTANRMGLRDFRTALADDELGDEEARNLMRRNNLRIVGRDVHDYMLGFGDGYTIVTPPSDKRDWSAITAESPLECITAHDPVTGAGLAGLKMFRDEWDEADWAYLHLPGKVMVARLTGPTTIPKVDRKFTFSKKWEWDEDLSETFEGGRLAMVRFRNRRGVGEFEQQLDTLDRINDKVFNEWWIGKIQAFRQRAVEVPDEDEPLGDIDPDADQPEGDDDIDWQEIFVSGPDALWKLPKGAKMWESGVVDLNPMLQSIKQELEFLASVTSTPLNTITPDAAKGSAEGASLMREEHVFKIGDRRDRADGSWAETLSLAFEFQGMKDRADVSKIETLWGPMEVHSLEVRAAAAAALWGKVPSEAILVDVLGYSPADVVDRLRALRNRDLIHSNTPTPASTTPATPAPTPRAV